MGKQRRIRLPHVILLMGLSVLPLSSAVTAGTQLPPQEPVVETYSYDSAGRLTRVSYGDGPGINYHYDANGSILQVEVTAGDQMFEDGFEG